MMDPKIETGVVLQIQLAEIIPSSQNPRGPVDTKDESFYRLVRSINEVGILVPLVVVKLDKPTDGKVYQLIDGERRYWAALELAKKEVPAHVLNHPLQENQLRQWMFHLHMTREQWKPLAQCRSLSAAYPELANGIKFSEKTEWSKKISRDTGMPSVLARDRVHVLSWTQDLKNRIYDFDDHEPNRDIYSYVLAIEASIVEPSRQTFKDYYNTKQPIETTANRVREALLDKAIVGFRNGFVRRREQIRDLTPLFNSSLPDEERAEALNLFDAFVTHEDMQFDDVKSEMAVRLPTIYKEKAPKPQRFIDSIRAFKQSLEAFDPEVILSNSAHEAERESLRSILLEELDSLEKSSKGLRERMDERG